MLQSAVQNVRDDFHIGMGMRGETAAARDAVVVDHPQRAKAHVIAVDVATERKRVAAVKPAEISMSSVFRSPQGQRHELGSR